MLVMTTGISNSYDLGCVALLAIPMEGMNRRTFLGGAAAAGLSMATSGAAAETPDVRVRPKARPEELTIQAVSERYPSVDRLREQLPAGSETFLLQVMGHIEHIKMRDEVCFVDVETGAPVAKVKETYIDGINPGAGWSETTRVADGYDGRWRDAARQLVASETDVAPETLADRTNYRDINAAVHDADETMSYDSVESIADVVDYFGDKPVPDAAGVSHIEYLREHIQFSDAIPKETQYYLRFLLPGLCAKESKFNDDLQSSAGAKGISQMLPTTVAGLGEYDEYVVYENRTETLADGTQRTEPVAVDLTSIPYTAQVEMMGKHIDNIYHELHTEEISQLLEEYIVPLFASRADYERYFLALVMVNAYNPGAGRMRSAIRHAITSDAISEYARTTIHTSGYDVFNLVAEAAYDSSDGNLDAYGEHSRDYVEKVFAHAQRIYQRQSV